MDSTNPDNLVWADKTIEQLAREQGIRPIADASALMGQAAELWASEDEFDRFLESIRERRHEAVRT